MWIEWPAGLLNLANITCIKLVPSEHGQWMIKAFVTSEDFYVRYFESEQAAIEVYEGIKQTLLSQGFEK